MRTKRSLEITVARSDEEILAWAALHDPRLIVIDAPLSLPRGRATIEDRHAPHLRECDRELQRRGIRFFPLTLGPMRMLTVRGMALAAEFRRQGFRVVEGYPGGTQDLLGIPRKQAGVRALQSRLRREGFAGPLQRRPLSHDELDAVTLAWTGSLFLSGKGLLIGDPEEGVMVLPKPGRRRTRV